MSQLAWNPTALADIQRIAEFIREHRPGKEQAIIGALIDRARQLETQPRSGQMRTSQPDGTEIRSLLVGKYHRLKYAVAPNDDVTILEVIDLRSDHEYYR